MTLGVRVIVQNAKCEILLVRHTYVTGWHLPGGGVDHGEDVATAAKREVYEETGISELTGLKYVGLFLNKGVSERDHVAYFHATTAETLIDKKNLEIVEARFVPKSHLNKILSVETVNVLHRIHFDQSILN
ncbi:NUDIX domain-containing protein [Rhodobacteraceae bacterium]|nr:NUDIX domain-containing protein [Paracoccaceae bacterium]